MVEAFQFIVHLCWIPPYLGSVRSVSVTARLNNVMALNAAELSPDVEQSSSAYGTRWTFRFLAVGFSDNL